MESIAQKTANLKPNKGASLKIEPGSAVIMPQAAPVPKALLDQIASDPKALLSQIAPNPKALPSQIAQDPYSLLDQIAKEGAQRPAAGITHTEQWKIETEGFIREEALFQKAVKRFWPDMPSLLEEITDGRKLGLIKGRLNLVMMATIAGLAFRASSMRDISAKLRTREAIANICSIVGEPIPESGHLPLWGSLLNALSKVPEGEIEALKQKLAKEFLANKEIQRFAGAYIVIALDGTHLHRYYSIGPGREKALFKIHNKGKEDEWIELYEEVLEAKAIIGGMAISIASLLIENPEDEEYDKQSCEISSSAAVIKAVRKAFPRAKIAIAADSLYVSQDFMKEAIEAKAEFIIRYKKGSAPSIEKLYESLPSEGAFKLEQPIEGSSEPAIAECGNGIIYKGIRISYARYTLPPGKDGIQKKFVFITSIRLTQENALEIIAMGRSRWAIENEGFNAQKNFFSLEHIYSYNAQASKNIYNFIQIAHMIVQAMELMEAEYVEAVSRSQLSSIVLEGFRSKVCDYGAEEPEKAVSALRRKERSPKASSPSPQAAKIARSA